MSEILVRPSGAVGADGTIVTVTPQSAGWKYVGFEALALRPGQAAHRDLAGRECCVVVLSGRVDVRSPHGDWRALGGRDDVFDGPPEAAYLPPGGELVVTGCGQQPAEVGLCFAPADTGAQARVLPRDEVRVARRGYDVHERIVHDVLMGDQEAERLLVTEVITPSGHWSSYPPHKHDRDLLPEESYLEETYYHRVTPPDGFGLQRVYTDDRSLDETVAVQDRDVVLVPRGYHAVAAPPGVALHYLNVMAGPSRAWAFTDDPALAWTRADGATTDLPIPKEHPPAVTTTASARTLDNYVGGAWTPATAGDRLAVENPATGAVLAQVPLSTAADVDAAVAAARAALPAWRDVNVIERARRLFALREGLSERREDLARSVTREMGKTIGDARAEVGRAIEMVEAACAIPTTMQGRVLEDVSRGIDAATIRQPVGVCAAIAPFNFPMMVPFWFLPFAIGCGNTFVLKPSEQVPMTQELVFEILDGLDLPPGVVNLVNGGREVVESLLDHPGVDAISFVGSAPVAKLVYERAAKTGKRVQALGGAKNHMVVMPDAVIDKTVAGLVASGFGAAGQRCMAGSVVVTVGDAHERLLGPLVEATRALAVGDGADEGTDVGPVVSCAARDRIAAWVDRAEAAGAKVAVDGRAAAATDGAYLGPTILTDVTPDMEIAQEEVFGPVLAVVHADTLDDAIAIVNASRFGNGTSIFTESGAAVRRYQHDVEAGMVGVNIGVAAPVAFFPFSGWKDSFLGDLHAHGPDAVEFFTRKKTVTSRWFSDGQGTGTYFVEH